MFSTSTARGLVAVSFVCGLTLTLLSMREESGELISLWLGIVATTLVGASLCATYFASRHIPALAQLLAAASASLKTSIIVWCLIGVVVMAIGTAVSEPARLTDLGLYAPTGFLYGALSGLAYWQFSRKR